MFEEVTVVVATSFAARKVLPCRPSFGTDVVAAVMVNPWPFAPVHERKLSVMIRVFPSVLRIEVEEAALVAGAQLIAAVFASLNVELTGEAPNVVFGSRSHTAANITASMASPAKTFFMEVVILEDDIGDW